MDIGGRVREARKRSGLSQEALARRAGVTLAAIGQLERGVSTDPHYSTLAGIAAATGTTIATLVGEERAAAPKASAPEAGLDELLKDNTRVGEWLRERGVVLGLLSDAQFAAHVRTLDLDEKDKDGSPLAVMELGRALTREQDEARHLLWTQRIYRPLGTLLPVDPDATPEEKRRQRRERLGELRVLLRRRYGRRAHALQRYAELLRSPEETLWTLALTGADEAA